MNCSPAAACTSNCGRHRPDPRRRRQVRWQRRPSPAEKQPSVGVKESAAGVEQVSQDLTPRKPALRAIEGGKAAATAAPRPKIVLLGMLSKIPVPGPAWLVGHYATGFERLGYEVYYVEAHALAPTMLMTPGLDDATDEAARYVAKIAERFGLANRWSYQALHDSGRCYGMSAERLDRLFRDAALIINMHGGTLPLPEHAATDRLVYLGTDPVRVELRAAAGRPKATELLDQHVAFFTWGLNFGNPDCGLPWSRRYNFVPSPPPVVLDLWENDVVPDGAPFTTIGNWRQPYRNVQHRGRVYRWSKHEQFLKVLDLPLRTGAPIELALSSYEDEDHLLLAEHGWRVRPGLEVSGDLDSYREYIVGSAGEVSVANEQNVHFRSGWFSERSATYLAAGRPVILQDTGFGSALPTGEGLFAFSDLDEAVEAVEAVQERPGPSSPRRPRDRPRVSEPRGRPRPHARARRASPDEAVAATAQLAGHRAAPAGALARGHLTAPVGARRRNPRVRPRATDPLCGRPARLARGERRGAGPRRPRLHTARARERAGEHRRASRMRSSRSITAPARRPGRISRSWPLGTVTCA